jgi:hypothetical protein
MIITGKTILVAGANRGIGQALAEEALNRGAKRRPSYVSNLGWNPSDSAIDTSWTNGARAAGSRKPTGAELRREASAPPRDCFVHEVWTHWTTVPVRLKPGSLKGRPGSLSI